MNKKVISNQTNATLLKKIDSHFNQFYATFNSKKIKTKDLLLCLKSIKELVPKPSEKTLVNEYIINKLIPILVKESMEQKPKSFSKKKSTPLPSLEKVKAYILKKIDALQQKTKKKDFVFQLLDPLKTEIPTLLDQNWHKLGPLQKDTLSLEKIHHCLTPQVDHP